MRQRTSKKEVLWESYDFYKIITVIKTSQKIKVKTCQNDQKESCRGRRDLNRYIRVIENGVRMRELRNFKVEFLLSWALVCIMTVDLSGYGMTWHKGMTTRCAHCAVCTPKLAINRKIQQIIFLIPHTRSFFEIQHPNVAQPGVSTTGQGCDTSLSALEVAWTTDSTQPIVQFPALSASTSVLLAFRSWVKHLGIFPRALH